MTAFLILIVVGAAIVYFMSRGSKAKAHDPSGGAAPKAAAASQSPTTKPLRDYLKEAESFTKAPRPLAQMVAEDRSGVLEVLENIGRDSGTMVRKTVVYALGQIGDESSLSYLREVAAGDEAEGVRDAATAAIEAITQAPARAGFTDTDRRVIIRDVYNSL